MKRAGGPLAWADFWFGTRADRLYVRPATGSHFGKTQKDRAAHLGANRFDPVKLSP